MHSGRRAFFKQNDHMQSQPGESHEWGRSWRHTAVMVWSALLIRPTRFSIEGGGARAGLFGRPTPPLGLCAAAGRGVSASDRATPTHRLGCFVLALFCIIAIIHRPERCGSGLVCIHACAARLPITNTIMDKPTAGSDTPTLAARPRRPYSMATSCEPLLRLVCSRTRSWLQQCPLSWSRDSSE